MVMYTISQINANLTQALSNWHHKNIFHFQLSCWKTGKYNDEEKIWQ